MTVVIDTYDILLKSVLYILQERFPRRGSFLLLICILFILRVKVDSWGHQWIIVDVGFSGDFINFIFFLETSEENLFETMTKPYELYRYNTGVIQYF